MAEIHPSAVVDPAAELGDEVVIGPFAVVAAPVVIGAGTTVGPHAVIHPFVRLGRGNRIHAHAVLGGLPQDRGFDGAETWLELGDDNVVRENVTLHRATSPERPTRIGSGCYLMANSHVAHDCRLGDGVAVTNGVLLAGHVTVGDGVNFGGGAAVHQFVRVGALSMVRGYAAVSKDLLPYSLAAGHPARHYKLNAIGLRRAGVKGERYRALEAAFRALRNGDRELLDVADTPETSHLRQWLAAPSKRGVAGWAGRKSRPASG